LVEQLNDAIKTREIIGEAKGILMAREGVLEDEAFQMLVTASQNTNTKLKEIAQKIVDETTQPAD
jgi:AmiR/NasT family two-component response regulator